MNKVIQKEPQKENGAKLTLLQPAESSSAALKMGIMGFAGCGKTYTASLIAMGLHKYLNSKKPVAFLDTETGSDFMIPKFQAAGVPLVVSKSRAFADLLTIVKEAEAACSILVIDSISHTWKELLASFQKKKNIERLAFHHWGPIKQTWQEFTDLYVNSPLHIIMCGRAGWEYDYEEDAEGAKELHKTGVKMKAESEMGYEPSILIQMEAVRNVKGTVLHQAIVFKDRADLLDGKIIENPTFESFLPHIQYLNLDRKHLGVDTKRTSEDLFEKGNTRYDRQVKREVLTEKIEAEFLRRYPGQSAGEKKARIKLLEQVFRTTSWKEMTGRSIEQLEADLQVLKAVPEEVEA